MQVMIKVGASANDKVDHAPFHQFDHTTTQPSRCKSTSHRETDGSVICWIQHLIRKDMASFSETPSIERLKSVVDEMPESRTPAWSVIPDWGAA